MPLLRTLLITAIVVFTFQVKTVSAEILQLHSGKQQNTLIELFTSQGCSSCPPAERWLGDLQNDPRLWTQLIPIAFHVDYWDYIGWNDQYAQPEFSKRQRRYYQEKGIRSVYTPGFVVNGQEWRNWFGKRKLPEFYQDVGVLKVDLNNKQLQAQFEPQQIQKSRWELNVAIVGVGMTSEITAGENQGNTLAQDFVVLKHIRQSSTRGAWKMELPEIEHFNVPRLALVAWVSQSDSLAPVQSVGGWLVKE